MNDSHLAMDGTPEQVFTRAAELLEMGLDIPDITRIFLRLQELGLPVEPVYSVDQAVAALKMLKEGNGHA
jgi:energy-coupling factor transport system ATP-binding protein